MSWRAAVSPLPQVVGSEEGSAFRILARQGFCLGCDDGVDSRFAV